TYPPVKPYSIATSAGTALGAVYGKCSVVPAPSMNPLLLAAYAAAVTYTRAVRGPATAARDRPLSRSAASTAATPSRHSRVARRKRSPARGGVTSGDRKSTRLNSSH